MAGCSKTDIFGYESYDHCMLEVMSGRSSINGSDSMLKYATSYCTEKFPLSSRKIVSWEDLPSTSVEKEADKIIKEADKIIKEYEKEKAIEDAIEATGINNISNNDLNKLLEILENRQENMKNNLPILEGEIIELRMEIEVRKRDGKWDISANKVEDMTDEELFK